MKHWLNRVLYDADKRESNMHKGDADPEPSRVLCPNLLFFFGFKCFQQYFFRHHIFFDLKQVINLAKSAKQKLFGEKRKAKNRSFNQSEKGKPNIVNLFLG
jgi:hypothetical protein